MLQSGPTRAPLLDRLPPTWRRGGIVVLALVLGAIGGGGAVWWSQGWFPRDAGVPSPPAVAGAEVRLVLSEVVASPQPIRRNGTGENDPLLIDGILLHSRGPGTATITRIHRSSASLAIRVSELPVRLSVNHSFERIRLEITARDCGLASEWTPSAQPFTLTWQDAHGGTHRATGGDHDASMEIGMMRYFDRVCHNQPAR